MGVLVGAAAAVAGVVAGVATAVFVARRRRAGPASSAKVVPDVEMKYQIPNILVTQVMTAAHPTTREDCRGVPQQSLAMWRAVLHRVGARAFCCCCTRARL